MCAVHPETPAVGLCPRSGAYMCQWCQRINDFGEVFCSTCMERVGYGTPIPWDRRQELGTFQAWWQTFKESMMKPDDFFARAAHGVSSAPPLLFAMICGWLGQIGYSVIRLAMNEQPVMILVSFATVPVGVLLSIYVGGGIAHLFAKMFGGTGTYAMTCRCWGYCHSPGALGLVPGLGALVAGFWTIVLEVYAVKHAHRISGGKAAGAVLLPLGIIVVLCCVGAMIIGAAAGAALGGSRGGF
ncbi:MAG: YIP1 family protein [Deltaproteobacteria bacterium]|nr:YIP1 family protein [Deltaproteobacteria bacterium]